MFIFVYKNENFCSGIKFFKFSVCGAVSRLFKNNLNAKCLLVR